MKKPVQEKTMTNWSLNKLKKELWKYFSIFVRMRDKGICFSCGKVIPDYYDRFGTLRPGWKSGQGGHFITAKNCGLALYFHEQNVHCQCYHCNINLSGNWLEYEKKIIEVYGQDKCDELKQLKWTGTAKYCKQDYIYLIQHYYDHIVKMEKKK